MADWTPYGLKDIPFLAAPAIRINSEDIRINGDLYYSNFATKELDLMTKLIKTDAFPWIFLQTSGEALGNGKSAFLANIYRKMEKENKNVLWAQARDDPRITNLLAEILDSFVSEGKLRLVKKKIGTITPQGIDLQLKKFPLFKYGYKTINALDKILNVEEEKLVYTFAIVKRSNPTLNHGELFGALLHLAYSCGESRFTIFIDQFEEYVLAHTNNTQKVKLGNEINDLFREIGETTTFVVSTHPRVTNELIANSPEADTFTKVENSSVKLPLMTNDEFLVEMAAVYLKAFRLEKYEKDEFFPFQRDIMQYSAERTELNPRNLILSLRSAMLYGAIENFVPINEEFLIKNHYRIFGGLENKWEEFKQGKWTHETT